MGDIKGMFNQVTVTERHGDFLRFLWYPGGCFIKNRNFR